MIVAILDRERKAAGAALPSPALAGGAGFTLLGRGAFGSVRAGLTLVFHNVIRRVGSLALAALARDQGRFICVLAARPNGAA